MGITGFKAIISLWLLLQMFVVPLFVLEDTDGKKIALAVDFGALALLIIMYFGLELLIGV